MAFGILGLCIIDCGSQDAMNAANVQIAQDQAAALAALTAAASTPPPTIGDYVKYGIYGMAGIATVVIIIKLFSKKQTVVVAAPAAIAK